MKVLVLAYQEIGCACLEALIEADADVKAVLTHEDEAGENIWFRSVARTAEDAGLPVYTPETPNTPEVLELAESYSPDFIFSFYYRHLLSKDFLSLARKGAYNMHGSLLPRYRGRAPINWVLVNGETETGMTLHRMTPRPDAGPIVAQQRVAIDEADTVVDLYRKMTVAAKSVMAESWPLLASGKAVETPQDEARASYYGRRRPEDGRVDWNRPAKQAYDLVRAVTRPYPGAFAFHQGRPLLIWSAEYDRRSRTDQTSGRVLAAEPGRGAAVACGSGVLYIREAQWKGGEPIPAQDLAKILPPGAELE